MPSLAMLGVLPTIALAFCAWAVYTGGLAALQHDCDTDAGPEASRTRGLMGDFLPCSKSYRLPWFYMAFEIVILLLLLSFVTGKKLRSVRPAMVGLLAVATVLFIDIANRMLDGESIPYYQHGQPRHRIRAIAAGAIMTALFNCLLILAVGTKETIGDKHVKDKHHVNDNVNANNNYNTGNQHHVTITQQPAVVSVPVAATNTPAVAHQPWQHGQAR